MVELDKDVKYIKGVGPNRVQLLNKLNINTLEDLITYFPRTYEDRSIPKKIYECIDGEEGLIEAMVASRMQEIRMHGKTMYKLLIRDDTGMATATWFNQSYLKNKFEVGKKYKFYGKINNSFGKVIINSTVFDEEGKDANTGKIIPIYPLTYNLSQNVLRRIMENGINTVNGNLDETLPEYLIQEYKLLDINSAIKQIHFPKDFEQLKNNYTNNEKGIAFNKEVKISEFINTLPFKLTKAQLRVIEEIDNNMESDKPMNRLLQGDVGSGKTVVSMVAAYKAVKSRLSSSNYGANCYFSNTTFRKL